MSRKRFTSEKTANSFAKQVNGKVNDLRNDEKAKSRFTVSYESTEKTQSHYDDQDDWSPEKGADFGYPNDYWDK